MKTPREILLERHQATLPKLDVIRREVINAGMKDTGQASRLSPSEKVKKSEMGMTFVLRLLWRELILPSRGIWTGLAAAWIFILAANFSIQNKSGRMAEKSPPPTAEMILTWRQQERLLAELIGPNDMRSAVPPKSFSPRPSSERLLETLVV